MKLETAAEKAVLSPSRLSHKFADGSVTLKELESFGPDYVKEFARQLHAECQADDPKTRRRRLIREGHRVLEELAEVLD